MSTDEEKPPANSDQALRQKMIGLFSSIRVRLTLWYVVTTTAALGLFGALLYRNIVKTMPAYAYPDLTQIAQQLFLLIVSILLFITIGGYWLAIRAIRPVHLITQTAREIGRTDLSRRIRLKRRDELGELADTFDEMLNRIEVALSRQRQFTADASHELRTPLSILNIATSRALSQQSRPESYEEALNRIEAYQRELSIIQAETDHMSRLVNDLLFLARTDIEQASFNPQDVEMGEVALEVVERFAPLACQQGIELTFGKFPELRVYGDHLLLTMMITNLVDNALKYTTGIGDHILIEGNTVRKDGKEWGWLCVEDNGPGIPEEHQHHIFERFYRVDVARSPLREGEDTHKEAARGSGLGLAIVQWVAQVHKGEIRLCSTVGQGSRFEVWLPLHEIIPMQKQP